MLIQTASLSSSITMTTVVATSRPSTRESHHILNVPSRLPFPTSPSLPGRLAKSKGLSTSLLNGDNVVFGRGLDLTSVKENEDNGQDQRSRGQLQVMAVVGAENGPTTKKEGNIIASSNRNSRVRRSHRNIVTSRKRTERSSLSSLVSHSTLSLSNDKYSSRMSKDVGVEEGPIISSSEARLHGAEPPPLPGGVFLTSLIFEESPRHTDSAQPPSTAHEAAGASTHVPPGPSGSTSSQPPTESSRTVATRNTFGLQRVYLEGLDYMRTHVFNVEKGVETVNRQFHKAETSFQDDWLPYLRECNDNLLQANARLLKSGAILEVIDTEAKLVSLLNNLREDAQPDKHLIEFLTTFWEEVKSATQDLQVLLDKFSYTVLHRIRSNYTNSQIYQLQVPICQTYTSDIENFSKDLESQLNNASLLLKNYGHAVNKDLFDNSSFHDRLMLCCDLKAFPILAFVSDISGRITLMCDTARRWLSRDEQFMLEINEFIRETRTATRKREDVLNMEKTKQKKVERNVKVAHNVLMSNRQKLCLIDLELQELEQTLDMSREVQQARVDQMQQKESMIDFLKVTLQQTKKNCRLQTKRAKLYKQVKELGDYVRAMEADLQLVQDQILAKSHEKIILTEKIHSSERSYAVLKTDLDKFSENLEDLEAEVSGLSGQLLQLEIVHTIRTSAEILDDLADRPPSVKLSKSLKDRIKQKHQKFLTLSR